METARFGKANSVLSLKNSSSLLVATMDKRRRKDLVPVTSLFSSCNDILEKKNEDDALKWDDHFVHDLN